MSTSTNSTLLLNLLVTLMIATILGGVAITLRRAKRQSVKAQIVKKSEIKKQRKEKILDDMEVSATVMPDEET